MAKQNIKAMIANELSNMDGNLDDEFVPSGDNRFLESKAKISEEEMAIDELLASVPKAQGYYLKLAKETSINQFEFKLRIDNWESWSDLEYEISNIVRGYTTKSPAKWGSGHYRVTVWRDGGLRGPKQKPLDFYIDALETDIGIHTKNSSSLDVNEQLNSLSSLLGVVKQISPDQKNVEPADIQKMISDAFTQGMNINNNKAQSENNTTAIMMAGMFTLLTEVLKGKSIPEVPQNPLSNVNEIVSLLSNLGIGKQEQPKNKSLVESLQELQAIGMWKQPKDEDPLAKISEMKTLMSLVSDLTGVSKGERPSTIEKIVEVIGPHVPEMVGKLTGTINNVIDYSKMKATGQQFVQQVPVQRVVRQLPDNRNSQEDLKTMMYTKLFNELHLAILANDTEKFPTILEKMTEVFGSDQIVNDISTGNLQAASIVNALTMYGGAKFRDQAFQPQLIDYINNFCNWIINSNSNLDNLYIVPCNICGTEFEYASKEVFDSEIDKTCGLTNLNGTICSGTLTEIPVVSSSPIVSETVPIDMNPYSSEDDIRIIEQEKVNA